MPLFPISDRVEQLFNQALQLPQVERTAFLQTACGPDTAQFDQITSLLTASEQADNYFESLGAKLGLKSVFDGDLELPQSKSVGPYKLIRLIGRGGMGAVYLAERADEHFEKAVALKILPIGIGGDAARQRFLAERQILARLVHPNIARLLDGGIAEQDTPYFVMDYIDGIPIDEYCDNRRLGTKQRIDLFLEVAGAVEYAHRNLVVHRDVKPGNVLVEADGSAMLVDFGVAKLLDPAPDDAPMTLAGQFPMTLLYSSPEAIRGEPVTTAMDIYSLGVLLYQLLSGCYPYRTDVAGIAGARHQILETNPQSASRAIASLPATEAEKLAFNRSTTAKSLAQFLRGDLDTILSMALAKGLERRYATVEQFVADLRRYQQQLPVLAQPPSLGYRFRKYVRRRKGLVAAVAAVALSLLALAALAVTYTIETRHQATLIAQERDKAVQISDFLVATFSNADPTDPGGQDVTARELLDRGAEQIANELSDVPEVYAALSMAMGQAYSNLTLHEKATTQLEIALDAYRRAGQERSTDYANAHFWLTHATDQSGDYAAAEIMAQRGIALNEEIDNPEGLADHLALLARARQRQGKIDDIEPLYVRALSIRREVYGDQHTRVAESLHDLGSLLQQQEKSDRALALHREGLEIRRNVLGEDHISLIESLYNLGAVTRQLGQFEEARAYFREALSILSKIHPEGSGNEVFMYSGLGHVDRELGEFDQAAISFRQAVAVSRKFNGDEHPNLGITLANLGRVLVRAGNCEDAIPILDESQTILMATIPEHRVVDILRVSRGVCRRVAGDFAAAERLLLEGYNDQVERFGVENRKTHYAAAELALLYRKWGKTADAKHFEQRAIEFQQQ